MRAGLSQKNKYFRLLLRGSPRMGAERFDTVNVKLLWYYSCESVKQGFSVF